jgi:hypothetical protein
VRRTTILCGPRDGTVSIVTAVVAILDKFRNHTGAPLKARTDLEPSLPDLKINITDVMYAIEAFTGEGYPFEPIGDPCGG